MTRYASLIVAVALLAIVTAAEAEQGRVALTDEGIALPAQIHFDSGTATVQQGSLGTLDRVAALLRAHPTVTIEIQAHSDSQGSSGWNLRLTHTRAEAIRDHLVSRGVPPSRLEARGYGETCPIDTNRTAEGRARNRRVVLVRTDRPVPSACPPPPPPPPPAPPMPPSDQVDPGQYQQ